MVRVGFGVRGVGEALPKDRPIQDPVTARAFCVRDGQSCCIWAVLDFLDFCPLFVDTVRRAIHSATGVAEDHVHVLTTHNHSVPSVGRLDLEVLAEGAVGAAVEAQDSARTAAIRFATTTPARRLNYERRLFVPELGGCVTFWYGVVEEEAFSAERHIRQVVRALVTDRRIVYLDSGYGERVPEEAFIDERVRRDPRCYDMPPADERVQVVVLEDEHGEGMGSLVRYSVHVHACKSGMFYSSDFPHHVRAGLEAAFGGHAIYLSGPCANISPATRLDVPGDEKIFGRVLADAAIARVRSVAP